MKKQFNTFVQWLISPLLLFIWAGAAISTSATYNPGYGLIEGAAPLVVAVLLLQFNALRSVVQFARNEAIEDYIVLRVRGGQIYHTKTFFELSKTMVVRGIAMALAALACCLPLYFLAPVLHSAFVVAALLALMSVIYFIVFNCKLHTLLGKHPYWIGTTALPDRLLQVLTGGNTTYVAAIYFALAGATSGAYSFTLYQVLKRLV